MIHGDTNHRAALQTASLLERGLPANPSFEVNERHRIIDHPVTQRSGFFPANVSTRLATTICAMRVRV